jgi:hypothetical protein
LYSSALIAVLLFFANSFYVWNWGDDYLFKVKFQTFTPLGFLINDYWIFDGRSLNLGYLISRHCLNTPFPWLATLIASILFFLAAYFLTILVKRKMPLNLLEQFILTITFTAVLWMAGYYSHFETLYWQTGMLYVVEVFLFYAAYVSIDSNRIHAIFLFLISFIAGIASPGAVMAILFVLIVEIFNTQDKLGVSRRKWASLAFFLGLLVVVLSPGSTERFKLEGGFDKKAFSLIHNLYFRLYQFIDKFFDLNTPMLWVLIVVAVFFILIRRNNSEMRPTFYSILFEYRWLIAAGISLAFYFPRMIYYITSPRLNIHIVFFVMLFFVTQLAEFGESNYDFYDKYIRNFQVPVLLIFIVLAFYQFWGASFCVKKMAVRIELYKANKGQHLVLKANDLIGPPATREFIDITDDSTYALNIAVAKHFGLKSIRKEKYR